ncbi:hypothetical protein [Ruminococcus sp.]|uniref:hypothetical protein n=1 Tax=Ruminococcus sp. TaxID=41978 RepID=UPI003F12343C
MKSKTFKKLTALMIAVMLVFSMCITGISASAAAVSDGTRVVYLKPNSNWTQSGARFAVYLFQGSVNTWTDMSDEDGDGYYEATLPEGEWEKIIFCRMNPNSTTNGWSNKWNQTSDLDIPDDMNCYTVKDATWDKGGGEWSLYDPENPTEAPSTEATEGTTRQVITGDPDSYYLFGYINNANYACEEDSDNAGEYKFVDNQVTAKFDADSYVAVKKGDNSAWYMTEGWLGTTVKSALLKNTNDITGEANKLYVPGGVEVTFTLVDNGDDTFTLSYASATDPTGTTDPTEVTEPTEPVAVDYYLFGSINGANYGCEEDYANMGDYKFVDGKLTVEFTEMSYVGVKTTDNGAWYMTNGWQGVVNEVTLYNTSTLGETADKLVVPAGVVNFTLVVNDDDTLTLSYESDVVPTIPTEEPTDPTESTDPTEPVAVDYYLFGSINGANYGCEEDYANMGDYKFVDGKLTVEFTEMSYVGVKTTDNGAWYMTNGWQGVVNEVTLYNTSTLGETADKLVVPAGVVNFTLVVNDDDTLTLSYESDVVPTIPTEEPTTEPVTEPTTEPATEPTTVPVTDVILKFAAPTSYASRNNWSTPVFFYGNTQSMDSVTMVEMTATNDIYYTTDTGSNTLLTTNGWKVFEVNLSADQVEEANAAKFAGFATADGVNRTTFVSGANVLKAGVDTYSATYGTAKTLGELNGKTFVIKDSTYGEKSCTSYVGYWVSEYVTVKVASPLSSTTYSTWDKASLYYGDTTTFDNMTKIEMINTGETTKVTGVDTVKTLKSGRWYINAITVDTATAAAINSAKYAGFCKTDAVNRTSILMNVLKAKTNVCDGSYNSTARTLADVAGQVFVIKDKTSTVETSVSTYIGEWETEDVYTQGKDDTVTIYFAAPKGAKSAYDWSTGVELYYGNTAIYTATERLVMTETDKTVNVSVDADKIPTLASGEWTVYSLTLTVEQIKAIDDCANVGFVKTGSYNRTSILSYRNIGKASKMDGVTTYNGVKESIETFDGYVFVINDHYPSSNEPISYTGSWIVA